jgi:hypothetical protein
MPWDGADTLEWTHLPTPAPYHTFERSAGRQVEVDGIMADQQKSLRSRNLRTALIIASIALAGFVGVILRSWLSA